MTRKKKGKKPVDKRTYVVRADLSNFELAKAKSALKLVICRKGEAAGELQVGRGSLYWRGANRINEKRIPWRRFAAMMDELAYGKT